MGRYRLSVVVPAFNEVDRIASTVERLRATLEPAVGAGELQILVVDDGSTDDTADAAARAGAEVLRQERESR